MSLRALSLRAAREKGVQSRSLPGLSDLLHTVLELSFLVFAFLLMMQTPGTEWQFYSAIGYLLVSFLVGCFSARAHCFLFGLSICLLPMFGAHMLSAWVAVYLIVQTLKCKAMPSVNEAEYVSGLALSFVALAVSLPAVPTLLAASDLILLKSYVLHDGWSALVPAIALLISTELLEVLRIAVASILGVLLFRRLCQCERLFPAISLVIAGLYWGALAVVLIFLLQFADVSPYFSATRTSFWVFTNRYSASLSDPNAFGLLAGLLVPLFIATSLSPRKPVVRLLALALAVSAFWSGSRSYLLLLAGSTLAALWYRFAKRSAYALLIGGILLVGIPLALSVPLFNQFLQQQLAVPSLTRVLASLHTDTIISVFETRILFWKVAVYLWSLSPMTGIGLGQFYHAQAEAAAALGVGLGTWRDNANNYYLQYLAEGGLISLSLLLFAFLLLFLAVRAPLGLAEIDQAHEPFLPLTQRKWAAAVLLLLFALLLFIGPHLHFAEVQYLIVLLAAVAVSRAQLPFGGLASWVRRLRLLAFLVLPLVYAYSFTQGLPIARGFYQQEGDIRWTAAEALFSYCDTPRKKQIQIAAPRPDLPLGVRLLAVESGGERLIKEMQIASDEPQLISVNEPMNFPTRYKLEVERVWQPSPYAKAGDSRLLGVQVFQDSAMCARIGSNR